MSHYTVLTTLVEEYEADLLMESLNALVKSNEFEGLKLEKKGEYLYVRHPSLEKYRELNVRFSKNQNGKYVCELDEFLVRGASKQVMGRINQVYSMGAVKRVLRRSYNLQERQVGESRVVIANKR